MSSYGGENLKPKPTIYKSYSHKIHIIKSPLTFYNIKSEGDAIAEYLNNGWEIIHQSTGQSTEYKDSSIVLITVIKKTYEIT